MIHKKQILLIVLLVLAAGGIYLYQNLGGMVTRKAEQIASDALGVDVHIGSIDVSLSDKKVEVKDIAIANPPGFSRAHIMTAKSIDITLENVTSRQIDFKDITVKGSVVNMEVNDRGMNLLILKDMANRSSQQSTPGSETVRVIVQRMVVDASTIHPSITLLDRDIAAISLPPVTVMGENQKSMPAGDAIVKVISSYFMAVEQQVRRAGVLDNVPGVNDIRKNLDNVSGRLKNLF